MRMIFHTFEAEKKTQSIHTIIIIITNKENILAARRSISDRYLCFALASCIRILKLKLIIELGFCV